MKLKFRLINILFISYLTGMALLTPVFFFPAIFIHLFSGVNKSYAYIHSIGAMYSRHLFWVFGFKVQVSGIENLPKSNNICFISNHQGYSDIPLIIGFIPKKVGFIAKKELARIPMMNIWLKALGCILIDRKNIRQSLKVIEKGAQQIQKGHPMVIFPEGTRSRNHDMIKFKPGAFKILTGANALAVPITINGSYKIVEKTGIVTASLVKITIHPAIDVSKLTPQEKKELPERIYQQIKTGFED